MLRGHMACSGNCQDQHGMIGVMGGMWHDWRDRGQIAVLGDTWHDGVTDTHSVAIVPWRTR